MHTLGYSTENTSLPFVFLVLQFNEKTDSHIWDEHKQKLVIIITTIIEEHTAKSKLIFETQIFANGDIRHTILNVV